MKKLYSQLLGMPILEEAGKQSIASIRDVIIDPENGAVLAFAVGRKKIVASKDISFLHDIAFIADRDDVIAADEILRVEEVLRRKIFLPGSRVVAQREKVELGRLVDFEIDLQHMRLHSIEVARIFLVFQFDRKIIPASEIVRIERGKVIVKSSTSKAKEKALRQEISPSAA